MASNNDVTTKILDIQVRYEDALDQIAQYRKAIEDTKARQKELKEALKEGTISQSEYGRAMEASRISISDQNNAISTLTRQIKNQQKAEKEELGSLVQLRAQLSNLNAAYDSLSKKERESAKGKELLDKINDTTTTLKAAEEETQRYFRNVGNYPGYEGAAASSAEALNKVLSIQAKTISEAENQNKALKAAIRDMDLTADGAKERIAEYNAKIAENNELIKENSNTLKSADDVMANHATTINEAKEQNSILSAAINEIDLTADGAMEKIAEYNGRIQENNDMIKSATDSAKEQNSALAETENATQSLDDILSQNVKTVNEAEEQNKKLKAALNDLDLTAPGVENDIERINQKLEENSKLTGKAKDANQELADKLGSILGMNLKFGKSLDGLSSSSASAGNAFTALKNNVSAFSKTLFTLLSNPYVLAFLGLAGTVMVAKWIFDYNKNLQEASRLTKEFTGLTGNAMKSLRSEIIGVADTYGKEFKDVLAAADGLVAQFGISFDEAMQIIKDGFVAGADLNGNFLQQLEQYPVAFREAGLSAQQMTAMIAQTRSGIFSEKGMDLIAAANKKMREMSQGTKDALATLGMSAEQIQKDIESGQKSMFEVYQEVAGKLSEIPENSEAAGKVIKEVFGKVGVQAGYELVTCLKDIDTNLETVKEQTGEVGKAEEALMNSQIELENKLAALFDMTGGGFESLGNKVKTFTNEALIWLLDTVTDLCNWFIDLYNESITLRAQIQYLGLAFKVVWDIIKAGFTSVVNVFKLLGDVIKSAATALSGLLTLDFDKAVDGVKSLGTAVTNFYQNQKENAISTAKEIAQDTIDSINSINDKLEPINLNIDGDNDNSPSTAGGTKKTAPKVVDTAGDKNKSSEAKKKAEEVKKQAEEERKLMEQLQAELLKLTKDGAEKRRKTLEESYDKQIRDLQNKLETDEKLTETGKETINKIIETLEKEKQQALEKLSNEELKKEYENQTKINDTKLAAMKAGQNEQYALRQENLRMAHELALMEAETAYEDEIQKQEAIAALKAKYQAESDAIEEERRQKDLDLTRQALQNQIDALEIAENDKQLHRKNWDTMSDEEMKADQQRKLESIGGYEAQRLQLELEAAQQNYEALLERGQLENQTEEEFNAEKIAAAQKVQQAQKNINDKYLKNEEEKYRAMKSLTSSLTGLLDTLGESNKAFAIMSKVIALAQIAIDTGKALAAGIAEASAAGPFPANIAAIATTVATITANIATAIATVKSAKFAQGGKVTGPGTGTSDSIPAMLSNGEFVMTARATKMFEPLLMAMNNIGSGVPMQANNAYREIEANEALTSSFESAAKEIKPVVSVVEINEVQNRVEIIENLDTF